MDPPDTQLNFGRYDDHPNPYTLPPLQFPTAATTGQPYEGAVQPVTPLPSPSSSQRLRDPRLMAQETNDTMTALASARRIPSLQLKDLLPHTQESCSPYNSSVNGPYPSPLSPSPSSSFYYPHHQSVKLPGELHPASGGHSPFNSRVEEASRPHTCSYCGKRFSRPSALKIHLSMHTGEKPFICPESGCHRSFSVRSNMSRHVRIVHQKNQGNETDEEVGSPGNR